MNTLRSGPPAASWPCFLSRSPGEQTRGLLGPHPGVDTGGDELQLSLIDQEMVGSDCLLWRFELTAPAYSEERVSLSSRLRRLSGGMFGVGSRVASREELVSELRLSLELVESIGETELLSGGDGASEAVSASSIVVEEGGRRGCSVEDEDTSVVEEVIVSSLMIVDDACKTAVVVDEVIGVGRGDDTVTRPDDVAMTTGVIVTDGMTKSDDCDIGCVSELVDSAMTTVVIVTDGMTKSDDCDIGCASELVDSAMTTVVIVTDGMTKSDDCDIGCASELVDSAMTTVVIVTDGMTKSDDCDIGRASELVGSAMTTVVIVTDGMTKSDDCDIGCESELVDSDESVTGVLVGASNGILEAEEATSGISTSKKSTNIAASDKGSSCSCVKTICPFTSLLLKAATSVKVGWRCVTLAHTHLSPPGRCITTDRAMILSRPNRGMKGSIKLALMDVRFDRFPNFPLRSPAS